MAKKAKNDKITNTPHGQVYETTTVTDDSFLPPAVELERLQKLHPGAVEWILQRAEQEQNARLKFNEDNMGLAKKSLNLSFLYDFCALILSFIVLIGSGIASVYLIIHGFGVVGTVFAGISVVTAIRYILGTKKVEK